MRIRTTLNYTCQYMPLIAFPFRLLAGDLNNDEEEVDDNNDDGDDDDYEN